MNPPTVDMPPRRQVLQVATIQEPEGYGPYPALPKLVALCADGTLWIMRPTGDQWHGEACKYVWCRLEGPP